MADFNEAVRKLLILEGYRSDDPDDRGGHTIFGISKKAYPRINWDGMTIEQQRERAVDVYRQDYWQNYSGINSQQIAETVFNIAVNAGQAIANRLLQKALSKCGEKVLVDGLFGAKTLRSVNASHEPWLLAELKLEVISHYLGIVDRWHNQIKYLKGWIRRALQ